MGRTPGYSARQESFLESVVAEPVRCGGTTPVVTENDAAARLVPVDVEVVPHPVLGHQHVRGGVRPGHLAGDDGHSGGGEGALSLRGRVVAPDRVVQDADVVGSPPTIPLPSIRRPFLARRAEAV